MKNMFKKNLPNLAEDDPIWTKITFRMGGDCPPSCMCALGSDSSRYFPHKDRVILKERHLQLKTERLI